MQRSILVLVLTLFVITPVPIVQAYWLGGLAVLFAGRWPSGMPPAWQTGRVERWPSSQELREQRMRQRNGAGREQPAREPVAAAAAPKQTRSTTPKRKRKRRR